jgi:hypothetical protein
LDYLAEIKEFHRKQIKPYIGSPIGCREKEIKALEQDIGFSLPEAYRQYLRWMGKDYEGVFVGGDWFITHVIDNTRYLPELLAENDVEFSLPEHYLAFFSHQGYMMAWFNLPKEGDNPPAYFFNETDQLPFPRLEGKFTDVLFENMRGFVSVLPKLYKKRCCPFNFL